MSDRESLRDDTAWRHAVVRQYEHQLVGYTTRLLGDVDRARDVVQDAFLRLCREPRQKIEDGVRQWLFTVCRNRAMDVLKKENRMKTLTEERAAECASREPCQTVVAERRETARRAADILDELPDPQREVIQLKIQNSMSYREIASVTGLSVSNVGYLLHMGFKTMRQRLSVND